MTPAKDHIIVASTTTSVSGEAPTEVFGPFTQAEAEAIVEDTRHHGTEHFGTGIRLTALRLQESLPVKGDES